MQNTVRSRLLVSAVLATSFILVGLTPQVSQAKKPIRDVTAPTVAISAPAAGSTVNPNPPVTGTSFDNVAVAKVEVAVDSGGFQPASGTSSWTFSPGVTGLSGGKHTLTARATDTTGLTSTSSVDVTVSAPADTTTPAVSISNPTPGATLHGMASVTGTSSDNVAVARVDVALDSGSWLSATGTGVWSYALDTVGLANGTHTLVARATDTAGLTSNSSVTFNVSNPLPDTTAPSVMFSTPSSGASVGGTISVTGTSSDNAAVAKVEIAVDSGSFLPANGTTSWAYTLQTGGLPDGAHTLVARATDTAGLTSTANLGVTVANASSTHMVTPEGVTINVDSSVSGWTTTQIYDILKANAYQLSLIGPHLTIEVQTQYPTSIATSAGTSGGVYKYFNAIMYLDARPTATFPSRPDFAIANEYGGVWSLYHLYLTQQNHWGPWLTERGLQGDSRLDSSLIWSKEEMIADDYRMLFGTAAAISQAKYINPNIPDPRDVPGLRDWFINSWAAA